MLMGTSSDFQFKPGKCQESGTLAYSKSPKTSTRTRFQDELEAAVSARARRVIMDQYSEDFDSEEDDFLNELITSRKKKANAFKSKKAKTVNFEFSDDEDKPSISKRVSFLKTPKAPLEGHLTDETSDTLEHSFDGSCNTSSFSSKHHTQSDQSSEKRSDLESSHSQDAPDNTHRCESQLSGHALQDVPSPLPADTCEDAPITANPKKELPIPKPRQKAVAVSNFPDNEQFKSQDLNMNNHPNTSSCSSKLSEGTHLDFHSRSQSLSSLGEHSVFTKTTIDSESKNGFNSQDCENATLSFEELSISQPLPLSGDSVDQADCPNNLCPDNLHDTMKISAPRSKGVKGGSANTVKSKYLGSLQVLDRTFSLQDTGSQADSLRAAVYQDWIQKKRVSLKQSIEMKKKEESAKEKKEKEQEAKREDAIASYEAWKEKKLESLKVKAKEQQERIRKEQKAREETEEKRQTSKQVFEKWKQEHDILLKEKYRKSKNDETKQKLEKQEKEEERKKANCSAFTQWQEKKKNILHERAIVKRKELKQNTETERHLREEKDQKALDMYESWLARKNLEKKRHKEEMWFQGILNGDNTPNTPPPWSPPNKTIPCGK